jgi:hypothetical protein
MSDKKIGGLFIRISDRNYIGVSRLFWKALGTPAHLRFWWSDEAKVLTVSACDEPLDGSVPVPDYFHHYLEGAKIKNRGLLTAVKTSMGIPAEEAVNIPGFKLPDQQTVVFRKSDAVVKKGGA